ncbi:hypothetical protein WN55_08004 [Dufourea novaeangliae]|uniref:Uncharacterized protein n=1 Tax=Dufourea novaeangliae TaxID=178035 RepID=A0A154P8K6_DUFNO|nr:hypothetical protein WN55_08004 [Dufourea novaeangliae]
MHAPKHIDDHEGPCAAAGHSIKRHHRASTTARERCGEYYASDLSRFDCVACN